jgi:hypothetical protein
VQIYRALGGGWQSALLSLRPAGFPARFRNLSADMVLPIASPILCIQQRISLCGSTEDEPKCTVHVWLQSLVRSANRPCAHSSRINRNGHLDLQLSTGLVSAQRQ